MIYTKVTRTSDIESVLPLVDVKRALGLYDTEDDDEVSSILGAAFDLAERYCNRQFTPGVEVIAVREDSALEFFLPFGENVIIGTVLVNGSETTSFTYNDISGRFRLTGVSGYSELRIMYTCGFEKLPQSIDRGIKFLTSTILNSGQDFVSGMDVTDLPLRATHLLDSEKYYVV